MDQPIKKANVLTLRGVYPKDFAPIDSIFGKATADSDKAKIEPTVVYTELPKKFLGTDSWLQFSNLKCWECDQLPISYPKFIPMNPEKDKNGNDICETHGHFCEWNCAVRYVTKEFPREQQWDAIESICLFESKFSGSRREKIMPCIPKTQMKAYCGKNGITSKQWREKIVSLNNDYNLTQYKLEHFKEHD